MLTENKITAVAPMACFKEQKVTSSVVIQTWKNLNLLSVVEFKENKAP